MTDKKITPANPESDQNATDQPEDRKTAGIKTSRTAKRQAKRQAKRHGSN